MENCLKESASDSLGVRNREFLKFIGSSNIKNKVILDIGCGFGWFEYHNRKIAKKIWAIDSDKKHIEQNKYIFNDKNIVFKNGSALKIPLENVSVDVVVASELIEHLPKETEKVFFREINRVLVKNGKLFLSTPNADWRTKIFDPAWYFGHRHYDYRNLSKIASENNFKMSSYRVLGSWWNLGGLLNMYLSKWVFHRRKFFENFFEKKEEEENVKPGFMNLFMAFSKIR